MYGIFKSKKMLVKERISRLREEKNLFFLRNDDFLNTKLERHPLIVTKIKLTKTLYQLKDKRSVMREQWRVTYHNFSWWNKLKYGEHLDLSELDEAIVELDNLKNDFHIKYNNDIKKLNTYYINAIDRSERRIDRIYNYLLGSLDNANKRTIQDEDLFSNALWLSMMSIPVSAWHDFSTAHNIYDTLREVNGNFVGMSNEEIWWESVWMPQDSLAGLVNLTKGAYFEELVAADTGGQLFEHFNQPDTDIEIDGELFQLKATHSASYIASVDEEIPVIATSEVAGTSDAIDSGYSNTDLTNSVELALGGSVIDGSDTALDALLVGAGSLGILATLKGIAPAQLKFDNGMEAAEAIAAGAGVAIEGTAKGVVDASEMAYKLAMSKPSRFVGRSAYKALVKLGNKI